MPYAPVREQWMDDAACTQNDPEWWFPEEGTAWYAKSVCAGCPVAKRCLEFALRENIPFGVWGGTSPKERAAIRRSSAA